MIDTDRLCLDRLEVDHVDLGSVSGLGLKVAVVDELGVIIAHVLGFERASGAMARRIFRLLANDGLPSPSYTISAVQNADSFVAKLFAVLWKFSPNAMKLDWVEISTPS